MLSRGTCEPICTTTERRAPCGGENSRERDRGKRRAQRGWCLQNRAARLFIEDTLKTAYLLDKY